MTDVLLTFGDIVFTFIGIVVVAIGLGKIVDLFN